MLGPSSTGLLATFSSRGLPLVATDRKLMRSTSATSNDCNASRDRAVMALAAGRPVCASTLVISRIHPRDRSLLVLEEHCSHEEYDAMQAAGTIATHQERAWRRADSVHVMRRAEVVTE